MQKNLVLTGLTALKISCGFGAGMGRRQEVCGAVSGAIFLIGCKYGKTIREDNAANDLTYKLVREFSEKFIAQAWKHFLQRTARL